MSKQFVSAVIETLAPLADPRQAQGMAAYMKHQFPYLGIATPARRTACAQLVRGFDGDPIPAAKALWKLEEREYQYVAVDLLRRHVRRLAAGDLPALEKLVQTKSWWDCVDALVPTMGEIVYRERALVARMDELIGAEDFWLRRVALLHQLDWKDETDEKRLFHYCLERAHEKEFFIRKAIGWALRQYARTAPDAVRRFTAAHGTKLSGLSLREATKHL
ncbi:MAG: DNA alkylation repair protein [Burkholderiaceae bacterium]|nr:DNA alkylation repair protein [Burkholderiaceae bacterium]